MKVKARLFDNDIYMSIDTIKLLLYGDLKQIQNENVENYLKDLIKRLEKWEEETLNDVRQETQ